MLLKRSAAAGFLLVIDSGIAYEMTLPGLGVEESIEAERRTYVGNEIVVLWELYLVSDGAAEAPSGRIRRQFSLCLVFVLHCSVFWNFVYERYGHVLCFAEPAAMSEA